uniref:Uncharacterized protein n=1 Tax=Rhizophora mucronata TaxID=61149 RepID=A0A2P2PGK5_RHIMU
MQLSKLIRNSHTSLQNTTSSEHSCPVRLPTKTPTSETSTPGF